MIRRDVFRHLLALGAGAAAGSTVATQLAQVQGSSSSPELELTRTRQSLFLAVPTGKPHQHHMVASLSLDLNEGDYVDIKTHFEGTNDLGFNVMFARFLKESPVLGNTGKDEGTMIAKPMAINITPNMHHGMLETAGDFRASQTRTHHFMLIGYAASSRAAPDDTIDVSYVEMRTAVWRAS